LRIARNWSARSFRRSPWSGLLRSWWALCWHGSRNARLEGSGRPSPDRHGAGRLDRADAVRAGSGSGVLLDQGAVERAVSIMAVKPLPASWGLIHQVQSSGRALISTVTASIPATRIPSVGSRMALMAARASSPAFCIWHGHPGSGPMQAHGHGGAPVAQVGPRERLAPLSPPSRFQPLGRAFLGFIPEHTMDLRCRWIGCCGPGVNPASPLQVGGLGPGEPGLSQRATLPPVTMAPVACLLSTPPQPGKARPITRKMLVFSE